MASWFERQEREAVLIQKSRGEDVKLRRPKQKGIEQTAQCSSGVD
jgi:hypothetical protein